MEGISGLGPFRPGPGGLPPYLAGREPEQALFRALLADLQAGRAPPGEVVLHGPRGNGKTTLLAWLEREAASYPPVEVLRLTPAGVPTEAKLIERLLPTSWWQRLAPREVALHGIRWRPGDDRHPSLDEALAARMRKAPLVMLLDEAHTLDGAVGRALLNASQQVGRELPFLLVLAGTPGLRSHLNAMQASFWSRAEQRPIDRLETEASAAALREPLAAEHIDIDADALACVVRGSQGYPYFLQVWGQLLWRQAAGAPASEGMGPHIGIAEVEAVRADFDHKRDDYYLHRYEELERQRLLPAARAVADALATEPGLDNPRIEAAIHRGLGPENGEDVVASARTALHHLGYVWRPGGKPIWEPGIPSLMDYVREYAPPVPTA